MRRVAGHEFTSRDRVDESSLGDVTVRHAREDHTLGVGHDGALDAEVVQGHVHVARNWTAANQARALGGYQPDGEFDVVAVVLVLEAERREHVMGNGQRVTLAGRGRAEPGSARRSG